MTRNTRGELDTTGRGSPSFSSASVIRPTHTTRSPASTPNSDSKSVVSTRALAPTVPFVVDTSCGSPSF